MESEPVASAASGTLEVFKPVQLSHPPGSGSSAKPSQPPSSAGNLGELIQPATNSTLLPKP